MIGTRKMNAHVDCIATNRCYTNRGQETVDTIVTHRCQIQYHQYFSAAPANNPTACNIGACQEDDHV